MLSYLLIAAIAIELALVAIALIILSRLGRRDDGKAEAAMREEFRAARAESATQAKALREEIAGASASANKVLVNTVEAMGEAQRKMLEQLSGATQKAGEATREAIEKLTESNSSGLKEIRDANEKKLEEMRQTVDEKLQGTLEKRLGESFKLVSERLEAVQKGLGEMQGLASGVGDLKRVLTSVKDRGTWGEYQLDSILSQILTPDQYEKNVATKKGSERVEFAVKLPGKGDGDRPVWLPIDAKFPKEDYERLLDAADRADADGVKAASKALAGAIAKSAKEIHDKYISPPDTTDFAILFLPTEGLYAEVLRQPGLHDDLQQKYRVLAAGPTTLAALLNSLRVGFQTLAIEKRAHEVWDVLGAVKTEFGKFGDVLDRVKKQLNTASNTIEDTASRTRAMERKLKDVQALPGERAGELLGLPPSAESPGEGESA